MVGDVERDAFGLLRDAGIARRAEQPVGQRARRKLPRQRVLAAAGTEEKNVHAGQALARAESPRNLAIPGHPQRPHPPRRQPPRRGLLAAMKVLSVVLLFLFGAVACAAAGDYSMDNRPVVVFKGGIVHQSPYPQGRRQPRSGPPTPAGATARPTCNWKMDDCIGRHRPGPCRPHLDACDRSCQRNCRGISGGPLLGFVDWSDGRAASAFTDASSRVMG